MQPRQRWRLIRRGKSNGRSSALENRAMEWLWLLLGIVGWIVLQAVILPRLGVPT
jgi:hypothetical protein